MAVDLSKGVIPVVYLVGILIGCMTIYAGWDNTNDRITMVETQSALHASIDDLDDQIKQLRLQGIHDKIAEIQSAITYYQTLEAAGTMTPELRTGYQNRIAQMNGAVYELQQISGG